MSQENLRASDAEREQVLDRLREAYVEGRLTLDEYHERMDAALASRTHGELQTLTADLPVPGGRPFTVRTSSPATRAPEWTVSMMSNARRNGRWLVDAPLNTVAVMSSCTLDLRQAELRGAEIVVNVYALMGSVRLLVPQGVDVDLHEIMVMGSVKDMRLSDEPHPGTPVVRVRGFGLMGSLEVRNEEPTLIGKIAERLGGLLPPPPPNPGQIQPPRTRHEERLERRIDRDARRLERHSRRER